MLSVTYSFNFSATHHIPKGSQFESLEHSRLYRLEVEISGMVLDNMKIIDPKKVKEIVKQEVINNYDDKNLNEMFEIPTVEVLLSQVAMDLKRKLKNLTKVILHESDELRATATYVL